MFLVEIYASRKRQNCEKKKMVLELRKQVTLVVSLNFIFILTAFLNDLHCGQQCFLQFSISSDIHDNISHSAENIFCREKWKKKKKKKVQRKTNESRETLIVAEFPRCDEIVKRFMKAFMKGFTSHGLNWGPEFASATHVLSRRRAPLETPRGPILILHLSLSFPLRAASQRAAFSLSILESASFFIIIISVVDTSSLASIASFSLFFFFLFFRTLVLLGLYFITGIFLG